MATQGSEAAAGAAPLAVSVAEAARLVGMHRAALYPRVMSGEIPSLKIGARRLVPVEALQRWLLDNVGNHIA